MRVLIVDDHELTRSGLRLVLADCLPGADFVEAGGAAEALAVLRATPVALLMLDLSLPGRDGLELLADLQGSPGKPRILVMSAFEEAEYAVRCLRLGADGYLPKHSDLAEIHGAVRTVLAGGKYVTRATGEHLAAMAAGEGAGSAHATLDIRELQVLRLVVRGLSLKQVAAELHLGERTVNTYRTRLGRKLGVSSNVELVRYAVRHRLVE